MKKIIIGIAVLIVLGLNTASLANVEKHHHYCKVHTTQMHPHANVTEYSNTNQAGNLDKEPNALENRQQFNSQADKQYQQEQEQAKKDKEPNALENKQQFKAEADKQYQQEQEQAKKDKEPDALENKQQFKAEADKQYQQEQNQAKRDAKRGGVNF